MYNIGVNRTIAKSLRALRRCCSVNKTSTTHYHLSVAFHRSMKPQDKRSEAQSEGFGTKSQDLRLYRIGLPGEARSE